MLAAQRRHHDGGDGNDSGPTAADTASLLAVSFLWSTYRRVRLFNTHCLPSCAWPMHAAHLLENTLSHHSGAISVTQSSIALHVHAAVSADACSPDGEQSGVASSQPAAADAHSGCELKDCAAGGTDIKWPHCFRKTACANCVLIVAGAPAKGQQGTATRQALYSPQFFRAAAELGLLNFVGTALQAVGLESTSATKGAFLIQTTAIFTPLLASLSGGIVSGTVWVRQIRRPS